VDVNGKIIKFQIWDNFGKEILPPNSIYYYRGADIAIFVFDLSNRTSFLNVNKWLEECKHCYGTIQLFLIGNKTDASNRAVTTEEAIKYAQQLDIVYMETSAKTGFGITEAFQQIARVMIDSMYENYYYPRRKPVLVPVKRSFCNIL
jgi:small GTP-binding protein